MQRRASLQQYIEAVNYDGGFEKKALSGFALLVPLVVVGGVRRQVASLPVMAVAFFFLVPPLIPIPMLLSVVDVVALYFGLLVVAAAVVPPDDNGSDVECHMLFLALSTAPWPGCVCFNGVSLA